MQVLTTQSEAQHAAVAGAIAKQVCYVVLAVADVVVAAVSLVVVVAVVVVVVGVGSCGGNSGWE